MAIVYDVPLPNGALAMQVAVLRLANMPGWSKVETRSGTGCGLSPDDFDAHVLGGILEQSRKLWNGARSVLCDFADILGTNVLRAQKRQRKE